MSIKLLPDLDTQKRIADATEEIANKLGSEKVNTSDIVNNLTSTDTNKPLSANQGKVLNDTTAKLAVSNVFTQPQQVPNGTLPQHTTNKLQVETMFEMFKQQLRGYNLASPDLAGKEYLDNGVYRLKTESNGHLDYDIFNGHYRLHGSFTGELTYSFGTRPIGEYYAQIWEVDKVDYSNSSIVFLGGGNNYQVYLDNSQSYDGKVPLYRSSFVLSTYKADWSGVSNVDVTFKLQLEKGSTATPYTVPGQIPQYSTDLSQVEPFSDVFYRWGVPTITSNSVVFPGGMNIYMYRRNLGYPKIIEIPQPNLTFDWNHNTNIVWDLTDDQIKRVVYPDTIENGIVLFKNIDGKLVGGALKLQYEMDTVRPQDSNKIYKSIGKTLAKTNITRTGAPNGGTVMGNEYWAFQTSNDENTNYADCHRWLINEETLELTHLGSFQHNWGHVNSVDYCIETDTLICGNGSGSYVLDGKIFIFENASSFKEMSQVTLIDNAIIIDVGMTYGVKVNVVWGSDNDGRYDIAHVITNDNKDIIRIQLGKGTNDLGLGNFVSGKLSNEFNGSYKVLKTWSQLDGGDVVQGADYGEDGFLYVGLGHSGAWYTKQWLNDDGSINGEVSKTLFINQDGTTNGGFTQSISEYKDKLILRIVKDGSHWAYVINK